MTIIIDYNSYDYMEKVAIKTHLMRENRYRALVLGGREVEINRRFFFCRIRRKSVSISLPYTPAYVWTRREEGREIGSQLAMVRPVPSSRSQCCTGWGRLCPHLAAGRWGWGPSLPGCSTRPGFLSPVVTAVLPSHPLHRPPHDGAAPIFGAREGTSLSLGCELGSSAICPDDR